MTAADLILAAFGIALGGFLKGATGAGAPVVGVPILALAFGVPKAGHWGFAALGSGPETEFEGKQLSQDAVIWIRAWDME